MDLAHAFSVPIHTTRLDPCDLLNRELERLFLSREDDEHRNRFPSHIPQSQTFESRFDLFEWPEPCIQALRDFVLDTTFRVAIAASADPPADLARLQLRNHSWFHITRSTGNFVSHNHALASWSAVYCVKDGSAASGPPAGGLLRLFDTRVGADAFVDAANRNLRRPFAVGHIDIQLQPGQLVVFPAYLFHEVTPYAGADTRITVASNCWFTTG